MRFFAIFAVLMLAVASFAVTAQYWGGYKMTTLPQCSGAAGYDSLTVANSPGDVSCSGGVLYRCPDVILLNTTTGGYVFGGPSDVTPSTQYFKEVLVDFIGRTNNGENLNGYYDRNAPKNLWRPRVFVKKIGSSCYNWEFLAFNNANANNLIGFSPADNGANKGGFYLSNETIGGYVPGAMDSTDASGSEDIATAYDSLGADGGIGDMPSAEVMSDGGILMKEYSATLPDYAGIRVYDLGPQNSWAFKKGDTSFDMMPYKWTTWNQFQIVPMPFTSERGTYFGHNSLKGKVSFDITAPSAPANKR